MALRRNLARLTPRRVWRGINRRLTGGQTAAPPEHAPPPLRPELPIAAMTMCWNEEAFLSKWVSYYGGQLGRENLYVLAHGDEAMVRDVARSCKIWPLPRNRVDQHLERQRCRIVEGVLPFLLGNHRAVLFGDVDEYIIADPAQGSLTQLVDQHHARGPSVKPINLNVLDDPDAGPLDFSKPILRQRPLARTRYQFCKPTVLYQPAKFVGGFHYSNHPPRVGPGLYQVHLHYADRAPNEAAAVSRQATYDAHPGTHEGSQRKRNAWTKVMQRYEDFNERSRDLRIEALDTMVPKLIRNMEANIVDGNPKRPETGKTMTYGKLNPQTFRIEIPDRFFDIF